MSTYAFALTFAAKAHAGQKRSNGDNYIIHPIRVSQECKSLKQKIIALLHDTLEDTSTVYEELAYYFGDDIAKVVLILTKREGEPYEDYIKRVKENPDAVAVKIADIADNLSDAPSDNAVRKSAKAIELLVS